jgi:hypothetical protein
VGRDVQRHLGLAEGDLDAGVPGELGGGVQDPAGAGQEVEEHRRTGSAGPVEVVADMAVGGGSRGDEPAGLGAGPVEVHRGDQPGEDQIAALGERTQLGLGNNGHRSQSPWAAGPGATQFHRPRHGPDTAPGTDRIPPPARTGYRRR